MIVNKMEVRDVTQMDVPQVWKNSYQVCNDL